jgi:hypothetical protein
MSRKNFIIGLVASLTLIAALTVGSYLLFKKEELPRVRPKGPGTSQTMKPPSGARLVLSINPAEEKK